MVALLCILGGTSNETFFSWFGEIYLHTAFQISMTYGFSYLTLGGAVQQFGHVHLQSDIFTCLAILGDVWWVLEYVEASQKPIHLMEAESEY